MYSLVVYKKEFKNQWENFAKQHGTVFHSIAWKEILEETFGFKSHYVMAFDEDGMVKAIMPIATGRNLLLKKIGMALPFVNYLDICAETDEARDFIIDQVYPMLSTLGLDFIELRFKDNSMDQIDCTIQEDNYTFILPLDGGEEKVMELSSANNRNHTRKTYKNEWFKASVEWERINDFYEVYSHTMKRLGSPCPKALLFHKLKEKLGDDITLLTVMDADTDRVIGGMTLFTWGDTVYYQWGGALEEYNKKYVNNFMYWEAIKFSINKGYKFLDLGRSPVDSGTYKFKSHFGAEAQKLTYYRISGNPRKVRQVEKNDVKWAIELWKRMPKVLTDKAGEILIKYVMP